MSVHLLSNATLNVRETPVEHPVDFHAELTRNFHLKLTHPLA
ncbi:hypothetical protein [Comamonas aquatica]|nr:hypothetical protein [Comamonas aquatica]